MSDKKNICILLTATVNPMGMPFVHRSDPKIREDDYISSFKKWVKMPFPLVFCENSCHDITKLEKCANDKTEILQDEGQDFPKHLGKGFGEMQIIEYAVQNSRLISECDWVVKVTGRYFIKNIERIVTGLLGDADTYVMANLQRELRWGDSYIFAFKPSFVLTYLLRYKDDLNDSERFYFEHALSRAILRAVSDGYKWHPLPSKAIISGCSGTTGKDKGVGYLKWLRLEVLFQIKNLLNRKRI